MMDPAELTRENEALNEQVKLLVKTERRLYSAQRLIEQQLRRQEALTTLAESAETAGDPEVMLALGLQTLIDTLDADQALALMATPSAGTRLAAMVTQPGCEPADRKWRDGSFELPLVAQAMLLTERPPSLSRRIGALLDAVDDYFAPPPGDGMARPRPAIELVVPLRRKSGRPLALVVVRKLDVKISYHEPRISEADLPFVELVVSRIEAFVENVLLYRELERFAAGLEEKVAQRTADLARSNEALQLSLRRVRETQAQLVEAEKSAAMLTLVAGLSHELNNPLGVILGYAQGLLSELTEPLTRRQLAAIERQARRCSVLVRAMLGFSEHRPMAIDSIPPAVLLQRVVADAEHEATKRGVSVFVDAVADDLPALAISEPSVREALGQLVKNALDVTAAGGSVLLHARQRRRNGIWGVELSVRDAGPGIPRAFLSRIFDPFFTTKPPGRGVGLGLSLARRTIETHGGRIEVRSDIRHGTTVRVWLPAGDDERDAGPSARDRAAEAR
jgi:signal transduction histidine kinase